ncbi:GMC family oxidoreductase [Rufibacter immobilis]|uniref:GMC family oxidoreductase n=1 Tax=Rufibacter immobilis TaxID=1348778 RepID=A0A3M9N5B7_9BACT|nr:GMC family oxidoreductase [Rufibacter immobilis]RNI32982.1 GMC family oxidoreductase [Rufibacter immobilis]
MIVSKEHLIHGQEISADLCIIGGGPAAISVALGFVSSNYKVVLVAGGDWRQTCINRDLYKGEVSPPGSHEPPERMRRRQFGGGSAVWAGRCVPFDPIDFRYRPWVPESEWPIAYEEMLPYFERSCGICQIGFFKFNAHEVFPARQKEIIPGFDSYAFVSNSLERYSTPINFAKAYKEQLEQSSAITVLLDSHAVSLQMQHGGEKISSLLVAAGTSTIQITAGKYVLASGGIENPRLLLASRNNYFPTGIGNQHDNVGRYYMTHITGTYLQVNPVCRDKILFNYEKDSQGIFCRRRWWVPEQTQEDLELLNTIFYLSYPTSTNTEKGLISSAVYAAAKHLSEVTGLRQFLRKEIQRMSSIPPRLERLYNLGLPAMLPSKKSKYWGLFFSAEQVPNRESRITLAKKQLDAFGMPRVDIQIAFKECDVESLVKAHNLFADRYREKKLGEIRYSEEGFRAYLRERFRSFNSYAHHMGTTRMADIPEKGVVDRNAKVFGVDNLFVAGASTFPTGGHANPTVTVVAQSLMLADHLKEVLACRRETVTMT